MDYLER